MLELIFQGFMEWAYGLTLECWQYFSSSLLDIMSMDFAYLKTHVPVIDDIMQVLMAVGWALLIGNLVFQALKSMASGLGFEGEDPKLLFTRTFVFSFLLLASPQICDIGLSMTSKIIDLLQIPDAVNVQLVDESVFGSLTAAWLLVIIFGIIIMFKVFKLILEIAERYVILAMLTITAPLAFSMGGSKSTSEIFTGWCRMFGSMCLLMVTNVIFFKMLLSVLSTVPSGLDVLPWMVLILTIVKVARKADAIITRIGLNPAMTGDSLGRVFPGALTYMVVRTAASQITKAVGKSAGGTGKGRTPGTPPGGSGGPRMGGPVGGRSGGAGTSSYSQQSTSQQATNQQTSTQQGASQQTTSQGTAYQSSTTQAGNQQTTTQEYTAGSSYQAGTQMGQPSTRGTADRKTSVPTGTRRSPTHVKSQTVTPPVGAQAVSGRPGMAGKAGAAAVGVAGAAGAAAVSQIRNGAVSPAQPAAPGSPGAVQHGPAGTPGSTIYIPYHADECAEGARWACQWNDAGRGTHRDCGGTDNSEHIFCLRAKNHIYAQSSGGIGSGPFGWPDVTDTADRYPLFPATAPKRSCGGAAESVRCPPDSRSFGRLEARSGRNADLGACSAVHTGTPARQECCSCGKCSADRDKAA